MITSWNGHFFIGKKAKKYSLTDQWMNERDSCVPGFIDNSTNSSIRSSEGMANNREKSEINEKRIFVIEIENEEKEMNKEESKHRTAEVKFIISESMQS